LMECNIPEEWKHHLRQTYLPSLLSVSEVLVLNSSLICGTWRISSRWLSWLYFTDTSLRVEVTISMAEWFVTKLLAVCD
jgi:hypothetical protein